jgi:hypothetical protein
LALVVVVATTHLLELFVVAVVAVVWLLATSQ